MSSWPSFDRRKIEKCHLTRHLCTLFCHLGKKSSLSCCYTLCAASSRHADDTGESPALHHLPASPRHSHTARWRVPTRHRLTGIVMDRVAQGRRLERGHDRKGESCQTPTYWCLTGCLTALTSNLREEENTCSCSLQSSARVGSSHC